MLESIFWQGASILVFLPGFLGLYLLLTSPDRLTVQYQNYMLRKTMRPLKDEDFSKSNLVVIGLKVFGFVLIVGSVALGLGIIRYS